MRVPQVAEKVSPASALQALQLPVFQLADSSVQQAVNSKILDMKISFYPRVVKTIEVFIIMNGNFPLISAFHIYFFWTNDVKIFFCLPKFAAPQNQRPRALGLAAHVAHA